MYEWKVFRVLPIAAGLNDHTELELQLRIADAEGWDVFAVLDDFTVILRRKKP